MRHSLPKEQRERQVNKERMWATKGNSPTKDGRGRELSVYEKNIDMQEALTF